MKIISHRGYWKEAAEKNLEIAFHRSFDLGFGTETDVRDCAGKLMISHDMPTGNEVTLERFLEILNGRNLPIAVNIKADGLAIKLKEILTKYKVADAFVFDMSVPDLLQQLKHGLPSFTRLSEYEKDPSCYDRSVGVWLDAFNSIWYGVDVIKKILDDKKRVAIVSPDLHTRDPMDFWKMLKDAGAVKYDGILLCTDFPEKARDFFGAA